MGKGEIMKITTNVNHLHKECVALNYEDSKLIADKMLMWLLSHKNIEKGSVGLACNQLGLPGRILLMKHQNKWIKFINPKIIHQSKSQIVSKEECLSVPKTTIKIKRSMTIMIQADNFDNKEMAFTNDPSKILQHEIDHLNGILITDKENK